MKIFQLSKLATMWPWTQDLRPTYVRALGGIDIAGGLGVLLPAWMHIVPGLVVVAAFGCIILQFSAIGFHASRREFSALPANLIFLLVGGFIFWGRWVLVPV